jgi:cell division protein DivIC
MFSKIKKNYFLLISTFLILYFIFNLLDGERGLFSYFKKKEILSVLKNNEINLINKTKNLKFKNSLLSDNLDLDYIETLIREKFLLSKKTETVYIIKNNDNKTSRKN